MHMKGLIRRGAYIPLTGLGALIIAAIASVFLTSFSYAFLDDIGVVARLDLGDGIEELWTRLFLLWILALFLIPAVLLKSTRDQFLHNRQVQLFVGLYLFGLLASMADTTNALSGEENWIRNFTAGVLVLLGGVAAYSATQNRYSWIDRALGVFFALLFTAAAADEMFTLHEQAGHVADKSQSIFAVNPQDLVTLSVGLFGIVVIVMVTLASKLLPWVGKMLAMVRYQKVFGFFSLAVFSFLSAMLLDTYDRYLRAFAVDFRADVLGDPDAIGGPVWVVVRSVANSSNGLEEALEYFAAVSFLMMVGTLFSVRWMGCDGDEEDPAG
jgi:hypothetical protein